MCRFIPQILRRSLISYLRIIVSQIDLSSEKINESEGIQISNERESRSTDFESRRQTWDATRYPQSTRENQVTYVSRRVTCELPASRKFATRLSSSELE